MATHDEDRPPFQAYAYLNIDHPVVAWAVYRGVLISAQATGSSPSFPMSMLFAGMIRDQDDVRLQNEALIERVRAQRYPQQVSRLAGIYVFEDFGQAREATKWNAHFREENLAELEIYPAGDVTRVDSEWITCAKVDGEGRFDQSDLSWIDRYWDGRTHSDSAVWETIVNGRALVLGTEFRERAYEVISKACPNALETLKISKAAAEAGSDLGQTAPWVRPLDANRFRLDYYINLEDADMAERERLVRPNFLPFGCEFVLYEIIGG